MVEFALLVPIIMVVLVGLLDFARAIYYYNVISNSAREGAREAILVYNQCQNTAPCSTTPSGSSIIGVEPAMNRATGGIMSFTFKDSVGNLSQTPACQPSVNQGCVWILEIGSGSGCKSQTGTPNTGPGPTDAYTQCNFNRAKASSTSGTTHDIVVEIAYRFSAYTPMVQALIANTPNCGLTDCHGIMWAKSQMRAEY